MPEINIIVKARDEVSRVFEGILTKFGELDQTTLKMMGFGVAAIGAVGTGIGKLAYDAAQVEPVRLTFENLAESIGTTADEMLSELRPATMETIGDIDLMKAANKMMIMGLAESKEEAAELARLGVGLGTAMGEDALTGLEKFTTMLATQSTTQMQLFGLEASGARVQIRKLISEGLTRQEAFKLVVLDQGNQRLRDLGDLSDTAFVKLGTMRAGFGNVKDELGEALLPTLNRLIDEALVPIIEKLDELMPILEEDLPAAIGPAVNALIAMGDAIKPILNALKWIDEHREAINQFLRIGKGIMDIGMPGMMPVTAIRERRVPIPGGMTFEEMREAIGILGGGRGTGGRLGQGVGGSTMNINVYGLPGVGDAMRDVIEEEGRRTAGLGGP